MNFGDAMNTMMKQHKKTVNSNTVNSKRANSKKESDSSKFTLKSKRLSEPSEKLDPINDEVLDTLIKLCANVEFLKQEIREIREELEIKTDMSNHNTLSLKIDQIDGVVSELSFRLNDL